jgi:uncharacterized membrane protein (UPF0127 family)
MKSKFVLIVFVLITLVALVAVSCKKQNDPGKTNGRGGLAIPSTLPTETIMLAGEEFTVELAFTRRDRTRGLMFRDELAANAGMLFVFERSLPRTFHMENCLIDLDILFIKADGAIAQINTMQAPPPGELSKNYSCALPCKYVLELSAGSAEKKNITTGMKITLPRRIKTIIPEPD